jgi:isoleucyl-tRNA synthetase
VSQVEMLESPAGLEAATYRSESSVLGIGVMDAAGEKCDRCWNYSPHVGVSPEHPALCERCVEVLAGNF